jgi:hypothetical protein
MQSINHNHNISTYRVEMVKLLLSDIKSNIKQKLLNIYFALQNANKSKIKLRESILNIQLISVSDTNDLDILKSNSLLQINKALHIFKIHMNNTLRLTNEIDSTIICKESWNKCFSNYSEHLADKLYTIEEMTGFGKNYTVILNLVTQNGEDVINTSIDKKSDIKTLKNKVVIFYIMIINAMEVIANELVKTETFLYDNS